MNNTPIPVSFGQRLRQIRKSKGFRSQKELAEILKTSQNAISLYEKDERKPSHETIQKIALTLGVTTDFLLFGVKEPGLSEFIVPEVGTVGASIRYFGVPYDQPKPFACRGVYALRIMDDSMEPLAREGQRVLVDPDAIVASGDLVVVNVSEKGEGGEGWVFKQFIKHGKIHQFISINTHRGIAAILIKRRPEMRKAVAIVF